MRPDRRTPLRRYSDIRHPELVRAVDDPVAGEIGKIGLSVVAVVVATNRRRRLGCKSCSRIRRRIFLELTTILDDGAQRRHPAIAIGFKLIADRRVLATISASSVFTGGAS